MRAKPTMDRARTTQLDGNVYNAKPNKYGGITSDDAQHISPSLSLPPRTRGSALLDNCASISRVSALKILRGQLASEILTPVVRNFVHPLVNAINKTGLTQRLQMLRYGVSIIPGVPSNYFWRQRDARLCKQFQYPIVCLRHPRDVWPGVHRPAIVWQRFNPPESSHRATIRVAITSYSGNVQQPNNGLTLSACAKNTHDNNDSRVLARQGMNERATKARAVVGRCQL